MTLFQVANVQYMMNRLDEIQKRLTAIKKDIDGTCQIPHDEVNQFYLAIHDIKLDANLVYDIACSNLFDGNDDLRLRALSTKRNAEDTDKYYFEGGYIKDVELFFKNPKLLHPDDPTYDDYDAGYCDNAVCDSVVFVEEESEVTNA